MFNPFVLAFLWAVYFVSFNLCLCSLLTIRLHCNNADKPGRYRQEAKKSKQTNTAWCLKLLSRAEHYLGKLTDISLRISDKVLKGIVNLFSFDVTNMSHFNSYENDLYLLKFIITLTLYHFKYFPDGLFLLYLFFLKKYFLQENSLC